MSEVPLYKAFAEGNTWGPRLCRSVTQRRERGTSPAPPRSASQVPSTRWTSSVSLRRKFDRNVTKFAPHKALKLNTKGKLTFDERVEVYRVGM